MLPGLFARRGGAGKKLTEAARLWARGDFADEQEEANDDEHLDEQLAFWGLVPEAPVRPPVKVFSLWPENLPAWQLFHACGTQWLHGFDGPTGANYEGWETVMRRRRVPACERDRMFALLQAMERGALKGWAERRAEQRERNPRRGV